MRKLLVGAVVLGMTACAPEQEPAEPVDPPVIVEPPPAPDPPPPLQTVDGFTVGQVQFFVNLVDGLRDDVRADLGILREDIRTDLSANLTTATDRIDTRIAESENRMTWRFIMAMLSIVGILVTAYGVVRRKSGWGHSD